MPTILVPSTPSISAPVTVSSSLLSIIRSAAAQMGIAQPSYIAGNTDDDTLQMLSLLNDLGDELRGEFQWQALQREYRFTTQTLSATGTVVAGSASVSDVSSVTGLDATYMVSAAGVNQDTYVQSVDSATQITLSQAASTSGTAVAMTFGKTKYSMPSDYDRQTPRTQYDKSKRWSMIGPETPQQWQFLKSSYISTGPRLRYRVMGGLFQIWPMVTTSEYIGFEYTSTSWVAGSDGSGKAAFTADDDTCIWPDRLMILGLKKKFFEVKGFDPSFYTRDYKAQLDRVTAADGGGAPTLSIAPRPGNALIGIDQIPDTGYGGVS